MGSKKSHSYIARLFRHTPKKVFIQIFIYQFLNLFACYLYTLSLEGGDLDFLLNQIGYLTMTLTMSLGLTITVGAFNIYTCTGGVRALNLILQAIAVLYTLRMDLGADLQNHGQYNALVYFLLILPLAFTYFLCKVCIFIKKSLNSWKT